MYSRRDSIPRESECDKIIREGFAVCRSWPHDPRTGAVTPTSRGADDILQAPPSRVGQWNLLGITQKSAVVLLRGRDSKIDRDRMIKGEK